jgi:TonB-linked SusC/RagA family outer membrane protein
MIKKIIIYLILVLLYFTIKAQAQGIATVQGRVVDAESQAPLAGALIKVKATGQIVITNNQGYFNLSLSSGTYQLQISSLSYEAFIQQIDIPLKGGLIISLTAQNQRLNEVQVIGYGQTTKRLNTGSAANLTAKEIERQPITNILSALSGRMPGVMVQTTNGLPGGGINVQIRGKGSIAAGSDPLYIIDGVPFDGSAPNPSNTMQTNNNVSGVINPLNSLNPADIENITVLKDADATAIYGSRGSNGVIIIQTKKAEKAALQISLSTKAGISQISQRPKLLNLQEYLNLRKLAYQQLGQQPSSEPASSNYAPDLTLWSQEQATDWIEYLYGNTAPYYNAQMQVKSGSNILGANYHNEGAISPGNNQYQRMGLFYRAQMSSNNQKLQLNLGSQLTGQLNKLSNLANTTAYLLSPNYPLLLPDGSYNTTSGNNPAAGIYARSNTTTTNLINHIDFSYKPSTDLYVKLNAGYTYSAHKQVHIFPTRAILPTLINHTDAGYNSNASLTVEPQVSYSLKVGQLNLNALTGATYQNRNAQREYFVFGNFRLEELMEDFASASTVDLRLNSNTQYRFASIFSRLNANLNNTIIANLSLRRDGSSRFGPGNRFGNFGAMGVAWLISNTLGNYKPKLINLAKLRISYGTTGNDQIGDYQYLSTYSSPGANTYQGIATMRPSRLSNQNFKWETTHKFNIGVDLTLFNQRLNITTDYFINRSIDQLVQYSLPSITGFSSYQANLPAEVENTGLELATSMQWLTKSTFKWETSFNLTLAQNQLNSFDNLAKSTYAQRLIIGEDIQRLYGARFLQMDPHGKPQYADRSGELTTSPYLYHTLAQGSPDYYGGLNNTFTYKGLAFGFFVQFSKQMARGGLTTYPGARLGNNFAIAKDYWTPDNQHSKMPAPLANATDGNFVNSSLNVFDTSYLRIKNCYLSYQLQPSVASKLKAKSLQFVLEANNLYTFWNRDVPVIDPESGGTVSGSNRTFPTTRTVALALNVGF